MAGSVDRQSNLMPRDGAIIFSDLIGKTEVLRVTCEKCGRDGRYILARLIRQRGRDAKVIDWLDELTAECPKKIAHNMNDPCGARCRDLARCCSARCASKRWRISKSGGWRRLKKLRILFIHSAALAPSSADFVEYEQAYRRR